MWCGYTRIPLLNASYFRSMVVRGLCSRVDTKNTLTYVALLIDHCVVCYPLLEMLLVSNVKVIHHYGET